MENSIPDLIYTTFHACVQDNPQTHTFAPEVKSLKTLFLSSTFPSHEEVSPLYTQFIKIDQIEQSASANGLFASWERAKGCDCRMQFRSTSSVKTQARFMELWISFSIQNQNVPELLGRVGAIRIDIKLNLNFFSHFRLYFLSVFHETNISCFEM